MKNLIDKLTKDHVLSRDEFIYLLNNLDENSTLYLRDKAKNITLKNFGNKIYIRGLIEISNICKNNCYYCGIRRDNKKVSRYRLYKDDILNCCEEGYKLGFRTFVMQSGEDGYYNDDILCDIISTIRKQYTDCAITLSLGERSYESYKKLYDAGANRYLLRHETADNSHYSKLHPKELTLDYRKTCLKNLKSIGFQTGTGFMVGSPFQTIENIAQDLLFISSLNPEMVGIGPFLPHSDTPFNIYKGGDVELCLNLLSIIRLMLPFALIPATTALGTADKDGREKGILCGANVIMPNLSPLKNRKQYSLYDNKIATGDESAQSIINLKNKLSTIGYQIVTSRGDYNATNL